MHAARRASEDHHGAYAAPCTPHSGGRAGPGRRTPMGRWAPRRQARGRGSWLGVETRPASLPPPRGLSSPPATRSFCPYCVRLSPRRGAQGPDRTSLKASTQKSAQSPMGWLVTSRCWDGGGLRQEHGLGPPTAAEASIGSGSREGRGPQGLLRLWGLRGGRPEQRPRP